MAFLSSLVLFCLCCFASDVVELEPVQSGIELEPVQSTTYNCDNTTLTNAVSCNGVPYCHWRSSDGKCIDDPCLLVIDASLDTCDSVDSVICVTGTVPVTTQDCVGGGGKFCRSPANTATYDYCFWAQLRDGSCPSTTCKVVDKKCVSNSGTSSCTALNSEADCKMVPKCLWKSPQGCLVDPCFNGSDNFPCGTWKGFGGTGFKPSTTDPLVDGDCVQYQPYKSDGTVSQYCVYKDNSKPNLCYFLGGDSDPTSVSDHGATYPTYSTSPSRLPTCTGTISGCDDNPSGLCSTKINSKGGLAGLYCGDKDHGAASILHIPSLVVFLLASIFVSKFTL